MILGVKTIFSLIGPSNYNNLIQVIKFELLDNNINL